MSVPISQMWTVASYVLTQRFRGRKQYPLVLMLEPLFRCNLACAGCGKIQYPGQILRKNLTVEQCLKAVDECGAPIVSIPGGEPLMYPEIGRLVTELVARKKYIYLCTNAILLKEKLEAGVFTPSKYLSFSIHMDGLQEEHDEAVCKDGVFDQAVEGIREALKRGYRVTTNTTLFDGANPERVRQFFDAMMDLGVEGMMVSPGYSYSKAPDQEHFLRKQRANDLFSRILSNPKRALAVQPVSAVPPVPHGEAGLRVHALGESDLQRLRLAASVLSPPGGLRAELRGPAPEHPVGALREAERQREVPRLHGPLRVRGDGRPGDLLQLARVPGHGGGHRDRACVMEAEKTLEGWAPEPDAEMPLAQIVELAFDYRGNTTVVTRDGASLHGYVFNRDADAPEPFLEMFDAEGGGPYRVPYAEVRTIHFTGKDTAAGKSYAAWLARKQAEKAGRAAGSSAP